jgi:hypothetical protein
MDTAPVGQFTFAEWRARGRRLAAIHRAVPFALGAWLLAGEEIAGERYTDTAAEITGLDVGELVEMARVAARFEHVRCRRPLPFSRFAAVCDLEPVDADSLLEQAERERWSRRRLERAVREQRRGV